MKDFPQELVDAVLESADLDADKAWSRFSLVCWAWVPATRRHRFSFVELQLKQTVSTSHIYDAVRRSRLFLEILDTESCTFSSSVTRLSIDGTGTNGKEHPEVFRILSKLTALNSVQISVWSSELGIQPLQDWLSGLPQLTELTLNRMSFKFTRILLEMLESCAPLTSLTITTSSWESEYRLQCSKIKNQNIRNRALSRTVIPLPEKPPVIPYSRSGSIQQLHLDCPKVEFLEAFLAAEKTDCSRVHLEGIQAHETQLIGALLRHLGETLEHLSISFTPNSINDLCRNVDLRFNSGLRSLETGDYFYRDYLYSYDFAGNTHLMTLPSLLRQCVSPFLTDITISIYMHKPVDILHWADLEESLISAQVHSSRRITFFVPDLPVNKEDMHAGLLADIQSWLPRCARSALFEIVVQPGAPAVPDDDEDDWW